MPSDAPLTFAALFRARAAALGLVGERGGVDLERTAAFLERGHPSALRVRAVRAWANGERVPSKGRMELVLDALGVHGDDRLLAYRLASQIGSDAHEVPPVDAVSTP